MERHEADILFDMKNLIDAEKHRAVRLGRERTSERCATSSTGVGEGSGSCQAGQTSRRGR